MVDSWSRDRNTPILRLVQGMFSARDVEMARERLLLGSGAETKTFSNKDDIHNNFGGLTWGLLSRGKIFAKASGPNKGKICCADDV